MDRPARAGSPPQAPRTYIQHGGGNGFQKRVWDAVAQVGPDEGVLAHYDVAAPLSSRHLLKSYVLDLNKTPEYPKLGPEFGWVFYRNADGTTKVFEKQGFKVIQSGSHLTILRRQAR